MDVCLIFLIATSIIYSFVQTAIMSDYIKRQTFCSIIEFAKMEFITSNKGSRKLVLFFCMHCFDFIHNYVLDIFNKMLKNSQEGLCPPCKIHGRDFVHPVKFAGGIMSTYTKMSGRDFVLHS